MKGILTALSETEIMLDLGKSFGVTKGVALRNGVATLRSATAVATGAVVFGATLLRVGKGEGVGTTDTTVRVCFLTKIVPTNAISTIEIKITVPIKILFII